MISIFNQIMISIFNQIMTLIFKMKLLVQIKKINKDLVFIQNRLKMIMNNKKKIKYYKTIIKM